MGNKSIKKGLNEVFQKKPNFKIIRNIEEEFFKNKTEKKEEGIGYIYCKICVFKSIDDIYYLIYSKSNKSIISYNIMTNQKLNEIKEAHDNPVTFFQHYLDTKNQRDLLLSLPYRSMNLKIWNVKNFECILDFNNINLMFSISASCFLNIFDEIYTIIIETIDEVLSSNVKNNMKVYDLKGNLIKEINNSDKSYVDGIITYYDKNFGTNYIVAESNYNIYAYDYEKNKKYHIYKQYNDLINKSLLIYDKGKIIKLFNCCSGGRLRIWDFHKGKLLYNVNVIGDSYFYLNDINFYDDENLFVACENRTIYLLNLKYGIVIDKISKHKGSVLFVKKMTTEKYGDILISQGNNIIIWKLYNNN